MIEYFSLRRKLPAKADDNWRIIPPQAVRLLFSEAAPGID
jgi:hypothetical protein